MKYEYDTTYLVPKKVITTDAEGNKTEVRTTYNFDYLNANAPSGSQQYAMTKLHNDHVVVPVEQITVRQKAGTNESMVLSGSLTQFTIDGKPRPNRKYSLLSESPVALTNYVPLSVTSGNMNYDQRYRLMQTVDNYDAKLNPITVTDNIAKLTKSVVLDSYGRPIAEVSNAVRSLDPGRTNQVFHTSFEDSASRVPNGSAKSGKYVNAGNYSLTLSNFELGDYRLSYWQSADNGATWTQQKQTITVGNNTNTFSINSTGWIDEVRLMPLDARMTTCTYDDLGHKSSETDANGVTTYYEYDGFGRLTRVLDNDRNLLKEYFFGYKQ
jgi:YD repeat-containing protein